jgi:hypothetical protein
VQALRALLITVTAPVYREQTSAHLYRSPVVRTSGSGAIAPGRHSYHPCHEGNSDRVRFARNARSGDAHMIARLGGAWQCRTPRSQLALLRVLRRRLMSRTSCQTVETCSRHAHATNHPDSSPVRYACSAAVTSTAETRTPNADTAKLTRSITCRLSWTNRPLAHPGLGRCFRPAWRLVQASGAREWVPQVRAPSRSWFPWFSHGKTTAS